MLHEQEIDLVIRERQERYRHEAYAARRTSLIHRLRRRQSR